MSMSSMSIICRIAEWKEVIIDPHVELKRDYPHLLEFLSDSD